MTPAERHQKNDLVLARIDSTMHDYRTWRATYDLWRIKR